MGAPGRSRAIGDSLPLIDETFKQFTVTTPLMSGQKVGTLRQTTGKSSEIKVQKAVNVVSWSGIQTRVDFAVKNLNSEVSANQVVGTATVEVGDKSYEVKLVTEKDIPEVGYIWRLRHLGGLI